jgi:CubicO group peptidase (beta-lactamase class C family)
MPTDRSPKQGLKRLLLAAATTAAATVCLSAATQPAQSHPVVPGAIFDPPSVSWSSIRDATLPEFRTYLLERLANYLVVELDFDALSGEPRVHAILQRRLDDRRTRIRWDMTSTQFASEWAQARADGFRPIDQETYIANGVRYWAAAWIENVEQYRWSGYWAADRSTLDARVAQLRRDGYLPLQIDAYRTDSGLRYSALWIENADGRDWRLVRDVRGEAFRAYAEAYQARYRMVDIESYAGEGSRLGRLGAGRQQFAAIWVENLEGRRWSAQFDLSDEGYVNRYNRYNDLGYRLVDVERYGTQYAGIWRQNSDLPDWPLRDEVDALVSDEREEYAVPGVSVSIFQDGVLRYRRGHGYADTAGEWLDSRHVLRLASVSKAVAGVLLMQAIERGELTITARTRQYLPQMPTFHRHTVGDTVSNRSCIRHYNDFLDGFTDEHFETARQAAEEFWDDPLVCTPSSSYLYSTHAYTVFGAALEAVVGDPISEIVRDRITTPERLATLRPEDRGDESVRRAELYGFANLRVGRDDLSWKVLGGGLESSAFDLARFGALLLAGDIISDTSLTMMWTRPSTTNDQYGYGWNLCSEVGRRVVAKAGEQQGAKSYLRIYPDDGIVVAVLMNRRWGDQSAVRLGRRIGSLVLGSPAGSSTGC